MTVVFKKSGEDKPTYTRHPYYTLNIADWEKYRLTYDARRTFVERYLKKLSARESTEDFADRKTLTYIPAFASSSIDEIKNSVFQRTPDITRAGGTPLFNEVMAGRRNGVNHQGTSIDRYIGLEVLVELLIVSRVGVLVDAPANMDMTINDDKHPYYTTYCAENILNWYPDNPGPEGFDALLLREFVSERDELGLSGSPVDKFRLYQRDEEGKVTCQLMDRDKKVLKVIPLEGLTRIPFVLFDLKRSLLRVVADYQIALMNIESSDISFIRQSNYPFYYEFTDKRQSFTKGVNPSNAKSTENNNRSAERLVGSKQGRSFPKDGKAPGFINPNPETLLASMNKQAQMRDQIRLLVNLNLLALNPRRSSSESKQMDLSSLEDSLAFIARVLEQGENELAFHWAQFEASEKVAQVKYPESFKLKTDQERLSEAEAIGKIRGEVPSKTFQREMIKQSASVLLESKVNDDTMKQIHDEIEKAECLTMNADILLRTHEQGLIGDEYATTSLGHPPEQAKQGQEDRTERITKTLEAQGGGVDAARGGPVGDAGVTGADEKQGKQGRGEQRGSLRDD